MGALKRVTKILAVLGVGGTMGGTLRAEIPRPPSAPGPVFPEFRFASQADVSRVFIPMEGSLQGELQGTGEKAWVRLAGNFNGTDHERCSWDLRVHADLAVAKGIQFLLYVGNSEPISNLAVYVHSGGGWYRSSIGVSRDGAWERIVVDKSSTGTEGDPAGWGQVDRIRLSAWRARSDMDTELGLAALGPVGADSPILIMRADSLAGSTEGQSITTFARNLSNCLRDIGLDVPLLADVDVTPERLHGRKLLLLPLNPDVPDEILPALQDFVQQGGRVMTFYSLPEEIAALIGVRKGDYVRPEDGPYAGMVRLGKGLEGQPAFVGQGSWNVQLAHPIPGRSRTVAVWRTGKGADTDLPALVVSDQGAHMGHVVLTDDWAAKQRLLLALIGSVLPEVWPQSAARRMDAIGRIAEAASFAELRTSLAVPGASALVLQALAQAETQIETARRHAAAGEFAAAIDTAAAAHDTALRAWCLGRKPLPGEMRAFWCHSAFGLPGKSWDESIAFLAKNGFTAILPNMLWGGSAYYPSQVLPVHDAVAARGDQIQLCLDACRTYGVACHVWKVNWNMGTHADPAFAEAMAAAGRVQQSIDGTVRQEWLCPSHPENQALEIAAMVEIARLYPVDGIHFDYIRYPGNDFCFCDGCRQRFEAHIGASVPAWPRSVRDDEALRPVWLTWRRSNITKVVAAVAAQARSIRPSVQISAAVFRNWPIDRDGVGQDWKLWCEKGYLDFCCPMDYTDSNQTFRSFVTNQLVWSGDTPCYPGIGLSVWDDPHDAVKLIEQIEITRALGTGGFTVFDYGSNVETVLPYLLLGTTAK